MPAEKTPKRNYLLPVMGLLGVLMIFVMIKLGLWQLDRADQKQQLLDQVEMRASLPAQPPREIVARFSSGELPEGLRFQAVKATGRYLSDKSILIDNQVHNSQGGYQVITPFKVDGLNELIMVSRGWIAAGKTRLDIPTFSTPQKTVTVTGRLNMPHAKPPLWKEGFAINEGAVWQYLPISDYASQISADVFPLVVELAPENEGTEGLKVQWQSINDEWVAKHKGYAFQWFSMAVAFFIACLVVVSKQFRH